MPCYNTPKSRDLKKFSSTTQGVIFAICAFGFWGLAPIYFKSLDSVPAIQILLHRVVWSVVFLFLILALSRQIRTIRAVLSQPNAFKWLMLSSLLIATNWGVYIWAVNNGKIIEASLGYYINPLVNILLGTIFLSERPTLTQFFAIILASLAVLYQIFSLGEIPTISIVLALLFGFYGLVRKRVAVPSLPGLYIETIILMPLAVFYWLYLDFNHISSFEWAFSTTTWLLILAGPVTVLPLLAFNSAATRLRLSTIGFFQYLAPTINLFLAVFIYKEPLTQEKLITFLLIWSALLLISCESFLKRTKKAKG